jgi:hypothetical protein
MPLRKCLCPKCDCPVTLFVPGNWTQWTCRFCATSHHDRESYAARRAADAEHDARARAVAAAAGISLK